MILSRTMLKRVGEGKHPCRTPTVVWNQSPMLLLKRTALVALPQRFLMTRIRLVLIDVALLHGCSQRRMPNTVEGLFEVYEDMVARGLAGVGDISHRGFVG